MDKNSFKLLIGIVSNIKLSFDKYRLFLIEIVQTIMESIIIGAIDVALGAKVNKEVIKSGNTTLIDTDEVTSVLNPHGIIRLVREFNNQKLCYVFAFDKTDRTVSFESEGYRLTHSFGNAIIEEDGNIKFDKDFSCAVLLYEK